MIERSINGVLERWINTFQALGRLWRWKPQPGPENGSAPHDDAGRDGWRRRSL